MDTALYEMAGEALAYVNQTLAQVRDERPVTLVDLDPMQTLCGINALRCDFAEAGISVPAFPEPLKDPFKNLLGWQRFLKSIVTIH